MLHRGTVPPKMTMCFTTPMMSGSKIYRPPPPPLPSHAAGNYPAHPFPSITPSFQLPTFASHAKDLVGILVHRLLEACRSLQKGHKVPWVQLEGGGAATLPVRLKSHPLFFSCLFPFFKKSEPHVCSVDVNGKLKARWRCSEELKDLLSFLQAS